MNYNNQNQFNQNGQNQNLQESASMNHQAPPNHLQNSQNVPYLQQHHVPPPHTHQYQFIGQGQPTFPNPQFSQMPPNPYQMNNMNPMNGMNQQFHNYNLPPDFHQTYQQAPINQSILPQYTLPIPIPFQMNTLPKQQYINENKLSIPAFTKSNFDGTDASNREMILNNLIITSDFFLSKAHDSVLMTNTKNGLLTYCRLIKASIQALLILIKEYSHMINPQLECIICFKLARIYFYETENLNRAEDYINKSIAIASRNNLIKLKFNSEFLASQILNKSNSKVSLSYLNDKIEEFTMMGFKKFASILIFLKINNLLVIDYNQALAVLQSLSSDPEVDNHTRQLCFLYQINLQLYRGSPMHALELVKGVELLQNQPQECQIPIQLTAMTLLAEYLIFLQLNDIPRCKELMKILNKFILEQQEVKWKDWNPTGSFEIRIPLSLNEMHSSSLPFQVNWLNSDEFVIMFYTLSGISLLYESQNMKKKSMKFFSKCIQIIESQLSDLKDHTKKRSFPLIDLNNRIIRLYYLKYLINYYQALNNLLTGNFNISPLNEFLKKYNDALFTDEELCYYKLLIPKIFSIFGQCSQGNGKLIAARYYHLKARNMTKSMFIDKENKSNNIKNSVLTMSIGIGGEVFEPKNEYSEIYVYSTLQLLILYENEINEKSKSAPQDKNDDDLLKLSNFRNELYNDLGIIFKDFSANEQMVTPPSTGIQSVFKENFTMSNNLLLITRSLMSIIYQPLTTSEIQNTLNLVLQNIAQISEISPFLGQLGYYLAMVHSNELNEKLNLFAKSTEILKLNHDKILSYLSLKNNETSLRNSGHTDLADIQLIKIEDLQSEIQHKFEPSGSK